MTFFLFYFGVEILFKEEKSPFTYLNFHKTYLQFSYCKGTYINDVRRFRSFLTRFQLRPYLMIFDFDPQSNRFVKKNVVFLSTMYHNKGYLVLSSKISRISLLCLTIKVIMARVLTQVIVHIHIHILPKYWV